MGDTYTAASGERLDDAQIDAWCEAYEQGEFPEGERTVGGVHEGRPPSASREKAHKDGKQNGE